MNPGAPRLLAVLPVVAAVLAGAAAPAQERTKGVPVSRAAGSQVTGYLKLFDPESRQWAQIQPENPALTDGSIIAVCVMSKQAGFVSIWSRTLDGALPVRVFPNDLTPEDRATKGGRIEQGQELCIGDGGKGYGFRVTPPLGGSEVYLHWSPDIAGQFDPDEIPVIPDPGSVPGSRSAHPPYSATVLSYRVVAP